MNKEEYKKIVKKYTKEEEKLKNMLLAFIGGGIIGVIGVILYQIFSSLNIESNLISSYVIVSIILISSLLTGLGIFDKLVEKFKCGLIIPITGFAHSVTSASIDAKKDGLITGIGASTLKLAGTVILYGVVTSFILTIIKVVLEWLV